MKPKLMLIALMLSAPVMADQLVRMSDGRVCRFHNGAYMGCTSDGSYGLKPSPSSAAEKYLEMKVETRKLLNECLRKASWPGMPGADECERLYGR